ncbi:MAG TPA: L,D-transpeptidase family protein [Anaerolineaceae bacterium]|nr:L,D-transpeptidase family protein [Anaerolineaceae bacterium]
MPDLAAGCSRREFLRGATLVFAGALLPAPALFVDETPIALGRVTAALINVYAGPSFSAKRIGKQLRDQVLDILEIVQSVQGPKANPIWYRLAAGYVHRAYVQRVAYPLLSNPIPRRLPDGGMVGEITVPKTTSFHYTRENGWQPLYRLYYQSVHWITSLVEGPDGQPWYRVLDQLMNAEYHVPAGDVHLIDTHTYSPTGQALYKDQKKIVVSIKEQSLKAYFGDLVLFETKVSSGVHTEHVPEGELPTDTPMGNFHIQLKMPSRHMGNGKLTADPAAYELPGVPWVMVFQKDGIALHGTYWHDNFGSPMSHGCVNLRNADALWLFRWTDPEYDPRDYYAQGMGTLVQVV